MPRSTKYFKEEIKKYILAKYEKNIKILDIGAGCGTYSDLLKPEGYLNIDGVEVFEKYVIEYKLRSKYQNLFIGDINKLELNFENYDLIILGDVLEHLTIDDSKKLLNKIQKSNVIITIPFESVQEKQFGNEHEIHLQDDLKFDNFFERYGFNWKPLCLRFDYGVYTKETNGLIFIETGERPLQFEYENYLNDNFAYLIKYDINKTEQASKNSKVTIVTGMWDLGRGNLNDSFKRNYEDYLYKMSLLLKADVNMYIFVDKSDEEFIWKHRKKHNTILNFMSLDEIKTWFNFTEKTNEIRKKPEWYGQASWLKDSPQASLEGYNPIVMSKMFMLNNVSIWNPFNSEYFFWIDGGITSTVNYGYFSHDKVFDKLPDFINKNEDFVFLTYPYEGGEEIHGFERRAMAKYCNTNYVKFVCRGGFFGGKKERINELNGLYYSYLNNSLSENLMGTEESIFTILLYNHPELITQYIIGDNGLIWPFFENLKNSDYSTNVIIKKKEKNIKDMQIGLYVLTYNSPKQFEKLCISFEEYDNNFLLKPKKYLINNSLDKGTDIAYSMLCDKYGFEEIKKDNIGICGGRQFIAEHADQNNLDYHFFFEDDMFFYLGNDEFCKNGFRRKIKNFYNTIIEICIMENFDYLKWNFTEFFGDNSKQWAWYNVPQNIREKFFPENPKKSENDLGKEPYLKYQYIKSYKSLPYATGEVYYCNWPQIVSKEGNKKMFINTKWAHPFEQTWMSFIYQETIKKNIYPGILLASPTEHNRFEFYTPEERREN